MPVLTVQGRAIETTSRRVFREAARMAFMNRQRRDERVDVARRDLLQSAKLPLTHADEGAMKRAAAILIAEGITNL